MARRGLPRWAIRRCAVNHHVSERSQKCHTDADASGSPSARNPHTCTEKVLAVRTKGIANRLRVEASGLGIIASAVPISRAPGAATYWGVLEGWWPSPTALLPAPAAAATLPTWLGWVGAVTGAGRTIVVLVVNVAVIVPFTVAAWVWTITLGMVLWGRSGLLAADHSDERPARRNRQGIDPVGILVGADWREPIAGNTAGWQPIGMQPMVRAFDARDQDALVALSLRAWAPVFASLEDVLGESGIYAQMHPDWRVDQRQAVEAACHAEKTHLWVAEVDTVVAGFAAVQLDHEASMGEIYMIAVDPDYQRRGLGSLLTSFALDWIADNGMALAMVETGADPGHAPARRIYERAGFTQLPIARYFKRL